jgi:7-keto-8-aminopelargonate synthetase-like enzyme
VEVELGTLGKALGAAGGYVAGSRELVDLLIHRARSFVFSTAPVPAASAAALAALGLLLREEGRARRQALTDRIVQLRAALSGVAPEPCPVLTAILPVVLGAETRALSVADDLWEAGWYVPAIRYPTVARGRARLRVSATAAHSTEDVEGLVLALLGLLVREEPSRIV